MKEMTVLNRIDKLIDSISYEKAYIEIETKNNKLILEKDKKNQIGFKV